MGTAQAPSVLVRSLTNFNGAPGSWKTLRDRTCSALQSMADQGHKGGWWVSE